MKTLAWRISRFNTLSPTYAYRDSSINKNVVLLAQCLEDRATEVSGRCACS